VISSRLGQKTVALESWQIDSALDQLVKEPTRMRLVDGQVKISTIDLVFAREINHIDVKVVPSEVSDHHLIIAEVQGPPKQHLRSLKKVVIDWRKFNSAQMSSEIKKSVDELCRDCDSVELQDKNLTIAMNKLVPKRVIHIRRETDILDYHIEALKKKETG
jgi:hypothetical protein